MRRDRRATRTASFIGLCLSCLIVFPALAQTSAAPAAPAPASAVVDPNSVNAGLAQVMRELQALKQAEENARAQAAKDEAIIQHLQARLDALQAQNAKSTAEYVPVAAAPQPVAPPPPQFAAAMDQYLGQHQFTFTGAAAGAFIYDRQAAANTFSLDFEPIVLYRVNDWLLFEGTVEAALPNGSSADFQLPVATAQIQLNDYAEINAGIFDQPFGDWYEDQSPFWVNRFATAPLLYGAEAVIPPTDLGVQLRGGAQWGELGQDADYTVWAANGPGFDSALPQPVVGETLNPVNNIGVNSNGRTFGARFRIYPLPLDSALGRLELGASTLDGKWLGGHWFNSWGVDFAYLRDGVQARGEWVQTYRTVPGAGAGTGKDNRQGWYLQLGYFLENLPLGFLPDRPRNFVHHFEPLVRYSGVNQRAVVADEITTVPQLGFNGSPSVFSPRARGGARTRLLVRAIDRVAERVRSRTPRGRRDALYLQWCVHAYCAGYGTDGQRLRFSHTDRDRILRRRAKH